jgi:hypothetical protein
MANAMLSIEIYQFNGTWCFTDLERKLVHEPFVLGIPEIINTVLENNSLYEDGKNYRVLFADQEFPKSHRRRRRYTHIIKKKGQIACRRARGGQG